MRYIPELTQQEIEENHKHFSARISLYRDKGLDFEKSRQFMLDKAQPFKASILELGTGTGYITLALAKKRYKFISIDKDEGSLKTAALNLAHERVLSNVTFYIMDGKHLDFDNGAFNNVIVVNLFHHIDDINKILSEIDRVLRGNGKLLMADFNKEGFEIVDGVHRDEEHIHENRGITKDKIYSYFYGLGYDIKNYDEKCHRCIVAKKLIQK